MKTACSCVQQQYQLQLYLTHELETVVLFFTSTAPELEHRGLLISLLLRFNIERYEICLNW